MMNWGGVGYFGETRDTLAPTAAPSLLLGAEDAADFLGISRSEFYRLDSQAELPSPVPFGKVKRWARVELQRWVEAGCPPRHEWVRGRK